MGGNILIRPVYNRLFYVSSKTLKVALNVHSYLIATSYGVRHWTVDVVHTCYVTF
jgi:hypothetical protein